MGSIIGKSKAISTLKTVNGHEKSTVTVTTHQNGKAATLEKKTKKKEHVKNKKSLDATLDKCTGTDGGVISSSAYIRKLVSGTGYHMSCDSLNGQDNSRRQSDAPSKDVLELRDACIRRGIIKPETSTATVSTANEQEYEVKIVEESTNDTSTINVVNKEEQVESQTTTNVANNEKQIESQTTDEW